MTGEGQRMLQKQEGPLERFLKKTAGRPAVFPRRADDRVFWRMAGTAVPAG